MTRTITATDMMCFDSSIIVQNKNKIERKMKQERRAMKRDKIRVVLFFPLAIIFLIYAVLRYDTAPIVQTILACLFALVSVPSIFLFEKHAKEEKRLIKAKKICDLLETGRVENVTIQQKSLYRANAYILLVTHEHVLFEGIAVEYDRGKPNLDLLKNTINI